MPSSPQPPARAGAARFVVLEGMDGAGTTTQAELLSAALRARDVHVCLTAEPTDGPLGRVLRAHIAKDLTLDPSTAALTFSADRADHLARVIRPALARGEWVVCDRYLLSTLAYQGAEGIDRGWILAVSAAFEVPDLTVFLDVPRDDLAERLRRRGSADRYESPDLAERLRASYDESFSLLRSAGYLIETIDGSAAPDAVLKAVLSRLDALA